MSHKRRGHYCWCCARARPNERFSGRNHSRHLCRDCARLPAEGRQYRQAERDLARLLGGGQYVHRRHRGQFDRFLVHPNARVRALARQILSEQQSAAEEWRRVRNEEEAREEEFGPTCELPEFADLPTDDGGTTREDRASNPGDDEPF